MDNWGYVFSAYLLAFAVLLGYWLRLKRRIKRMVDFEGRNANWKRSNPPKSTGEIGGEKEA